MSSRSKPSGESQIDSQQSLESLEVDERLSTSQVAIHQDNWAESLPSNDFVNYFKSIDWSASILGPLRQWTLALRMHTFVPFGDQRPGCILWGPEKVAIYNEQFSKLMGDTKSEGMGNKLRPGIPGLNAIILETSDKTETAAIARNFFEIGLFPHRDGFIEEAYFNSTFLPLRDRDGNISGLYNSTVEVTKTKINERRLAMFNYMANPSAVNSGTLASHVMPQLEHNALDITMALLYELSEESLHETKTLHLRGNIGFPPHHSLLIETANLNDPEGLIPLFRENSNEILTFPVNKLFEGVEWRGFGESKNFSVLPITGPGRVFGYLVIGVNPRRPIDADHRQFMWDLASKISAVAASVSSADESRRRAQRLENELQDRTTQIQYLAQHASVGMSHSNLEQRTIWANEQYYQLVGRSREDMDYPCSFPDTLLDEDRSKPKLHGTTLSRRRRIILWNCV